MVFTGGFSNLGENAAFTAVRGTFEKTGLQVTPSRLLGVFSPTDLWVYPNGDQTQSLITIFQCQVAGGNLQPDQIETSAPAGDLQLSPEIIAQIEVLLAERDKELEAAGAFASESLR